MFTDTRTLTNIDNIDVHDTMTCEDESRWKSLTYHHAILTGTTLISVVSLICDNNMFSTGLHNKIAKRPDFFRYLFYDHYI